MKTKFLTLMLALLALLTLLPFAAIAESEPTAPESCTVTVSIINDTPVLAAKAVTVTDTDEDGKLTLNDALYCAHDTYYSGGAEAGYASSESQFGISLTKLWGDTSGAFGYYVNNAMPLSLLDEIEENSIITAFIYQDQISWTDSYSYFDKITADVGTEEELILTLSYLSTDYTTWETTTKLAEGARITVNGKETDITVDMNGNATVKFDEAGTYLISATSNMNLVSPVCVVTVTKVIHIVLPDNPSFDISDGVIVQIEDDEEGLPIFVLPICAAVICAAISIAVALSRKGSSSPDANEEEESNVTDEEIEAELEKAATDSDNGNKSTDE